MAQKISFALFLLVGIILGSVFCRAGVVEAGFIINEIMYDSEGADVDWLEVYNDGEGGLDLSSFKLLISNSTANHAIKSYSGSASVGGGEYGIIFVSSQASQFTDKWGSGGNTFIASFSLPNVSDDETATIELNSGDKNAPVDSVTYEALLGAKGDGNSLQLIEGDWESSLPTPGEENVFVAGSGDGDPDDGEDSDSDESASKKKELAIKAKILSSNIFFAGEPAEWKAAIMENSKDAEYIGRYVWNFGDGSVLTESGQPREFKHTYYHPGSYAVFLEYYSDLSSDKPAFETRATVRTVPVEVSLKGAGGVKDFSVEIENTSAHEIDISAWSLVTGRKYFMFPKNSVILPKKSLTISGRVTGFQTGDENDMRLFSSTGELISLYQAPPFPR